MSDLSLAVANHLVLTKQHLTDDSRINDIVKIVRDIGCLHATGSTVPYLSLFARTRDFVREFLDEELYVKRSLGKIRCMRRTLYILTRVMIPVAFAATREMVEKVSKRYMEFRGVSSEEYDRLSRSISDLLRDKEMTASEIRKTLRTQLVVSAVLNLMCDQGRLIRSRPRRGWKDRNQKYCLFHRYFPGMDLNNIEEMEARGLLVEQYLGSFGPVTREDIAWWTGLSRTKVLEALDNVQERIVRVRIPKLEGDFIMPHSDFELIKHMNLSRKRVRTVNLLPSLDPYLMGYKERERYLDHEYYDNVFDRSGNATSTILLDGRVVGVWDFVVEVKPTVKLFFFMEIEESVLREMYLKAQETGRFIADRKVQIEECDSMVPLKRRTAGGVMSPLKGC